MVYRHRTSPTPQVVQGGVVPNQTMKIQVVSTLVMVLFAVKLWQPKDGKKISGRQSDGANRQSDGGNHQSDSSRRTSQTEKRHSTDSVDELIGEQFGEQDAIEDE